MVMVILLKSFSITILIVEAVALRLSSIYDFKEVGPAIVD